jgi:hypothetical protein
MQPIGTKMATRRVFGGKMVNRGMKFGAKALGYIGDMAIPAAFVAPAAVPVLEAAKAASVVLDVGQKMRQNYKHRQLV